MTVDPARLRQLVTYILLYLLTVSVSVTSTSSSRLVLVVVLVVVVVVVVVLLILVLATTNKIITSEKLQSQCNADAIASVTTNQ